MGQEDFCVSLGHPSLGLVFSVERNNVEISSERLYYSC